MNEMLRLSKWAAKRGVTRQWATLLCQSGRLEGAAKNADGWWYVPAGLGLPERKPNEWLLERRSARAERKAEYEQARAARIEALAQERQARRSVVTPEMKAAIDQRIARDLITPAGSGGIWLDADMNRYPALPGWNAACEAYCRSMKPDE